MTGLTIRNYLAGGLMVATGLAVTLEARTFGLGVMSRPGPGLFPVILGVALAVIGVLIAVTPERGGDHEPEGFGRPDWRGWSCIVAGIVLFMALGEHGGLGPATFACVFVSALGDRTATLKASLALALAATLIALVVFSWLLKFQLPFLRW